MALLITNADIVNADRRSTADTRATADILCEGDTIAQIDRGIAPPPIAEVSNATGKHAFPGFIDPHTHIALPFMGTCSKDDYESDTEATLVGGTTTILEMVCPAREMPAAEGFALWPSSAGGKACCDYSFHIGVTRFDTDAQHDSRPPRVEAKGVHHLMTFAKLTRARVYIVHLSCHAALAEAVAAREHGVNVSVETLIQYLVLGNTWAEKPGFKRAKYVMSPPRRNAANPAVLRNGLRSGLVNIAATAHVPVDFVTHKPMGKNDFTKIPNGIPSIADRISLLRTHGVKTSRLSLQQFVAVANTNAGEDRRPLSPQRRDPAQRRCRSRELRPVLSQCAFGQDAAAKRRRQRLQGLSDRGPAGRVHGRRRGRGSRQTILRHRGPRTIPEADAENCITLTWRKPWAPRLPIVRS